MRRREFITLLGGVVAASPLAVRAQQPAVPVVGFVHLFSPDKVPRSWVAAFPQGLKEAGFTEGQNVAVEYHWAQGEADRYSALVADLARRQVAVIAATGGEPCPQLAEAITQTIPIVFTANGDPVQEGLVASLHHPGGNATGVTIFGAPAAAKRMQLLQDVVPNLAIIGYLTNPNNPNSKIELTAVEAAARSLGKEILILQASSESEIEAAFAKMGQQHGAALLSASDALFLTWRDKIASLAAHYRIPAIYYLREYAQAGGLMAYGNNLTEVYRLVGVYVGRILKGEKPADLPVVLSTKYELVINLKAAKVLGLTIPPGVFSIADEVIE